MKALVLEAADQLVLRDIAEPVPGPDESLIKMEIAGIGGSETLALQNPGIRPLPNVMGHSVVGTNPDGVRVAVNPLSGCGSCGWCEREAAHLCDNWQMIGVHSHGALAEYVVVPDSAVEKVPGELSWEQASFIEPFANSISAWEKVSQDLGDGHVLVIGAGSLGLGIVACSAPDQSSDQILVVEPSAERMAAAEHLGGQTCHDTETRQFDVVFDTVGSVETRALALRLANKHARVVSMGFAAPVHDVAMNELIRNEHRLMGSFAYSHDQFKRAIDLASAVDSQFVTNLGWEQVGSVLRGFADQDHKIVRAALRP